MRVKSRNPRRRKRRAREFAPRHFVHQSEGEEMRQMADRRKYRVVLGRIHAAHARAALLPGLLHDACRFRTRFLERREHHTAAAESSASAAAAPLLLARRRWGARHEARGSPSALRAVATTSRLVLPPSVMTAFVRSEREDPRILADGRGDEDEIGMRAAAADRRRPRR